MCPFVEQTFIAENLLPLLKYSLAEKQQQRVMWVLLA